MNVEVKEVEVRDSGWSTLAIAAALAFLLLVAGCASTDSVIVQKVGATFTDAERERMVRQSSGRWLSHPDVPAEAINKAREQVPASDRAVLYLVHSNWSGGRAIGAEVCLNVHQCVFLTHGTFAVLELEPGLVSLYARATLGYKQVIRVYARDQDWFFVNGDVHRQVWRCSGLLRDGFTKEEYTVSFVPHGMFRSPLPSTTATLQVEPGRSYFFRVHYDATFVSGRQTLELTPVDATLARTDIGTRVPMVARFRALGEERYVPGGALPTVEVCPSGVFRN